MMCFGGTEIGVDWVNGLVIHENDDDWHPWGSGCLRGERMTEIQFDKLRPVSAKAIEAVLAQLDRAHTVGWLAERTGLSYPTVKRALQAMNAKPVPNTYPLHWTKPDGDVEVPLAKPQHRVRAGAATVRVGLRHDVTPDRWNASSERIGNQIRVIKIERTSNPAELHDQFVRAASLFATLAHSIELVKDRPDWWDLLQEVTDESDI